MTAPLDNGKVVPKTEGPAMRSRWRRFSPSMGWRAFASEIVIVVLGVAIALAANEAVDEWSWHNKVEAAETRLRGDITWVFLWSAERYVTQPCVDAQLAALAQNLWQSGESLKPASVQMFANVPYVVRTPNRPYRFPVWDALVANGTATHFGQERQTLLGNISDAMAQARLSEAETRRLTGLLMIMRDPIELDAGVRSDLLTHINELRTVTAFEALNAQQRISMFVAAKSAPAADVVDAFLKGSGTSSSNADFSGTVQFCKARGLPLADWHDLEKVTIGDARQGDAK
jgi:hypothetical protein